MTELVTFGETMLRLSPPRGERLETTSDLAVQAGERRATSQSGLRGSAPMSAGSRNSPTRRRSVGGS